MHEEGIAVLFLDVAGYSFAVETGQVDTLRRKETLWPAREGPADLLGFVDLGMPVPVLDLGMRLGLGPSGVGARGLIVVLAQEVASLAFRVGHVRGPVVLAWEELAPIPTLLQELQPQQITWGFARCGDELIPLLDLGQVVGPEDMEEILELMM